ncbi:glycosyltransferase family 2 protein [Pseudomonas sp. PH1b]|uniref:glycosyltransferase family 2 protein n=1 Tax=Pseudomonas sp. PH1b TaxID=1397282 RepID=UPI0009DD3A88|nr:glycosyltransferase family 2 protein [Pseudomonas sp. PH1b]
MRQFNQAGIDVTSSSDMFDSQLISKLNSSGALSSDEADGLSGVGAFLPKVAILLCTYHGQHYLAEQLNSFEAQSHSNWEVWASDDGSEDDTYAILENYQKKWPKGSLFVCSGPSEGFAANFLSLTCKDNIEADFYAYSDQDDIWERDKLTRAVQWLQTVPADVPALYCSRTRLVDEKNNEIGVSPLFLKKPSFANALMQNIGGGNTMVFNNAARDLLRETGENSPIITHDWWAYIVVTGCAGQVFYDHEPTLRYRQHNGNLIGTNSNWAARLKRIRMLFEGSFKKWNDSNIAALHTLEHRLTPENKKIFQEFSAARKMNLIPRLIQLKRTGVYRQTLLGNIGLVAAAIFGKI